MMGVITGYSRRTAAIGSGGGGGAINTIYSASDTIADNARTVTLKSGGTASQNFQILNSAGKKGYYFDGRGKVGLLTSTFNNIGGGEFTNLNMGDATDTASIAMHFSTAANNEYKNYYALTQYVGANTLHRTDARGFLHWHNQANNANTDIQFNLVGNGTRIVTNSPSTSVWQVGYGHYYNYTPQALIATDNQTNGYITVHKADGSVTNIISGNRGTEATWFGQGIVLGGARYRAATPFFDVMGAGSTSATTTALFQNSSSVAALTIKDDLTSTFGGIVTVPQIITTPAIITVTANAGTVTRANRINKFTNSSAATMTITMSTTAALDGDMVQVRIYDFSAATQTITWVNTENSSVIAPTTSNGSTTLPLTVGFQYNSSTSKWRCIGSV